jgi:AhpD family alkylhydroperoxidase
MRTLAVSPAALDGYLALSGALARGRLGAKLGEHLALAVAERNACDSCLSAHTYVGTHVARLSEEDVAAARQGRADDARSAAALRFALAVLDGRGEVADAEVAAAREAGLTDAELAEVVAHVALNVLTNFFNKAAGVEIDFPVVRHGEPVAA